MVVVFLSPLVFHWNQHSRAVLRRFVDEARFFFCILWMSVSVFLIFVLCAPIKDLADSPCLPGGLPVRQKFKWEQYFTPNQDSLEEDFM